MKKIFKFIPILLCGAAIVPMVGSLTSCSAISKISGVMILASAKEQGEKPTDPSGYNSLKTDSFKNLLYGGTKYTEGNYIVLFGSNTSGFASLRDHVFDVEKPYDLSTWKPNYKSESSILKASIEEIQTGSPDFTAKDLSLFSLIDFYQQGSTQVECGPYGQWEKADEDTNSSNKEGSYIRNDSSAKQFREMVSFLKTIWADKGEFSTWFKPIEKNHDADKSLFPFAIAYKDGSPKKLIKPEQINKNSYDFKNTLKEIYKEKK